MPHRRARRLAPLALALALASCGDAKTTEPVFTITQADADDIAQQIAMNSVATDWGSYLLAGRQPPAPGPAGPARLRPSHRGTVAQWDTTFTQEALTFTFTFSFYDASLVPQDSFSVFTTWQVEEDSEVAGTIALADYDASLWHLGNLQFRGTRVSDDTLSFSGTARDTALSQFTSSIRNVPRWFHLDLVRTMDQVRMLKTAGSYPHAGTVRWIITATRLRSASRADVEATLDGEATLTFNGTRYPVLTLTGGWSYALDLETGAIARL